MQDATLVASVLDWVLSEFVRIYHTIPANDAQRIVQELVERRAPAVQDFDGFLKVLNPALSARSYVLLLLYQKAAAGASLVELEQWVRPTMRANLQRTLYGLQDGSGFVHGDGARFYITMTGVIEVEKRRLYEIPS
jgi:hypothetical protein